MSDWVFIAIMYLDCPIQSRPAVQKGVHIPSESLGGNLKNDAAMTIEIAKNLLV